MDLVVNQWYEVEFRVRQKINWREHRWWVRLHNWIWNIPNERKIIKKTVAVFPYAYISWIDQNDRTDEGYITDEDFRIIMLAHREMPEDLHIVTRYPSDDELFEKVLGYK